MDVDLSNRPSVRVSAKSALKFVCPPAELLPSEWAELHVKIPSGNAIPGPVRFRNAPYQVEPLNMIVDPDCYRITLMFGAQTGKTQVQLMAQGYFIDHSPQNQMMMQPTESDGRTWLNAKFDPMIASSPALSEKVAKARGRDGINNQEMKQYPGGFLMLAHAGSPRTQRGRSAAKIFADETDGYERTEEGHPVNLLFQRAATFGDEALLFETSTPTVKGQSHIETSFQEGDQRRWYVACHECGAEQYLVWEQVKWSKGADGHHDPSTAYYECEHCQAHWDDGKRYAAIRAGQWIAAKPFKGHASYHLPELASTFRKLKDIVQSFIDKKKSFDLQTFYNVSLAETWDLEVGEKLDWQILFNRREKYAAEVPKQVVYLTGSIDTQDDRLEFAVWGWAPGEESYLIWTYVLDGNPASDELKKKEGELIHKTFKHETGVIMTVGVWLRDSGGHYTEETYEASRKYGRRWFYPSKGHSTYGKPIATVPRVPDQKTKVYLVMVGTDNAKDVMYQRLTIQQETPDKSQPGYCHFPMNDEICGETFLKQLTAERKTTVYRKGKGRVTVWDAGKRRNEATDLFVLCLAGLRLKQQRSGLDLERLAQEWDGNIKAQLSEKETPKKKLSLADMGKLLGADNG